MKENHQERNTAGNVKETACGLESESEELIVLALREIREQGDPVLEKKCKPVQEMTPRIHDLIADMFETMYANNGCGLAAPQVGILRRITVIDVDDGNQYVLINPEIIEKSGSQTGEEGCLSVPGMAGTVTRAAHVKVRALNENFEPYELEADELLARCIQHECDHLDGHLYVEKVEGDLHSVTEEDRLGEAE